MIVTRDYIQKVRDWLAARANTPETELAFDGSAVLWPNGIIPYSFRPDITPQHQQAFKGSAAEWASVAHLTFVARTTETNYLDIQNDSGNSAALGMIGGPQDFTMNAWVHEVICHELGHSLGLVHEHQRSDRETYVTILEENIQSGLEFAFCDLARFKQPRRLRFLRTSGIQFSFPSVAGRIYRLEARGSLTSGSWQRCSMESSAQALRFN